MWFDCCWKISFGFFTWFSRSIVPIWTENSYLHSLLHTCVTMQNGTEWNVFFFFSFLLSTTILFKTLFLHASNQTDDGKPKGMHAVKNHYTPFETKKESMKKIQRNESKEFNKRPNEVPNWSLFNNRLQYVTTSMLQSDRLLWRGSTRRFFNAKLEPKWNVSSSQFINRLSFSRHFVFTSLNCHQHTVNKSTILFIQFIRYRLTTAQQKSESESIPVLETAKHHSA